MAKILEKNFWARDFANVVCQTRIFEDFITNFPDRLVRDRLVGAVATRTMSIFKNL